MEWNRMEWNGTARNRMEWIGLEWKWRSEMEMEWNGMEEWNEQKSFAQNSCSRSSQIRAPGFSKSVTEAPMGTLLRFWEHFEQQVGRPWPVWAAIGAL